MVKNNLDQEFDQLIGSIKEYNPRFEEEDLLKAWEFAKIAHTGQKRFSGEDYIIHPLQVAVRLSRWKLDKTSLIAGLLHDTIEDGGATRKDIVENFGEEVALLVDGVTKVTSLRLKGSKEQIFIENLRKMLLVMAKDLRVILVKLADRLHNMETLGALSKKARFENAQETLEIYAPLAERLGIGRTKGELEDLAFPHVYPKEYEKVRLLSVSYYKEAEEHIKKMKKALFKKMITVKVAAEIRGRKKHLFSLWRKLQRAEIDQDFDKIHDIVALRIFVKTIPECYSALGVVHNTYKPVPNLGVSDFIAQPKPNGYRSIHTKVFGPGGRIVEVQIRTYRMHEEAEYGVAAHWAYSEAKKRKVKDADLERKGAAVTSKLSWVKQLVEWQKEITDTNEFLEAVKFDAFGHRNFVFSPNGDVYDLPSGATPIDFAYAVHTALGQHIKAAKVDGRIVSLDHPLKSGNVVEIIKSKNAKIPNRDWLNFAVTTTARREIKKHYQ